MTDNVVNFPGLTCVDLPPDNVLEGAKGQLSEVLVLGVMEGTEDLYIAGSKGDLSEVNWLLDLCKQEILRNDTD